MGRLKLNLLVIDDDSLILEVMQALIPEPWQFIGQTHYSTPPQTIHVAFVDLHLSDDFRKADGLEVIQKISQSNPHTEIVAISGDLNRELMEKALKAGATRFLPKPLTPDEILLMLNKIEALFQLRMSHQPLRRSWVGKSKASEELLRQIAFLKGERTPILIEGESGAGKDVVASLLNGQEDTRPFVTVNVASIPDNLFESEFFGYAKGAFTGALQSKMGLAESANGGDLFLDEIEALPLNQQTKLLRFLESGDVRRVGSNEVIHVDTRVIAASNEKLSQMVAQGKFREDLLWRLSGHKIAVPALREHKEDIAELCQFFMKNMRPQRNKSFSEDAFEVLKNYSWPGNVRELKRVCEQLAIQAPLPLIRGEDVAKILNPSSISTGDVKIDFTRGLTDVMNDFEKKVIEQAAIENKDVDALAKLLQISRSNLYKKLKDYNITL
ncbi:MAG: sigma-54 dependent transcriptional regulator [Bdellovibrionales bacterium]|nr:sigma-54 dependent transcriptional regulator [Bdellovibrionales bacterium]